MTIWQMCDRLPKQAALIRLDRQPGAAGETGQVSLDPWFTRTMKEEM